MRTVMTAAALALVATTAFAQMPPMLGEWDKDSSGTLSPEELKVGMPNMTDADWKKYDLNADMKMDQDEYTKMIEMVGK